MNDSDFVPLSLAMNIWSCDKVGQEGETHKAHQNTGGKKMGFRVPPYPVEKSQPRFDYTCEYCGSLHGSERCPSCGAPRKAVRGELLRVPAAAFTPRAELAAVMIATNYQP